MTASMLGQLESERPVCSLAAVLDVLIYSKSVRMRVLALPGLQRNHHLTSLERAEGV